MNKAPKSYPTYKRPWPYRLLFGAWRLFRRTPQFINDNETLNPQAIFLANHSGLSGPLVQGLYFPTFIVPWGTYEMTDGYRSRWRFMYQTTYREKMYFGRCKAFVLATFVAFFSPIVYHAAKLIPTYPDLRLLKTFRRSAAALKAYKGIIIFPEDSETGYHERLVGLYRGFVVLHRMMKRRYHLDVPVYPVYYHKKRHTVLIGKAESMQPLLDQGLDDDAIADYFLAKINALHDRLAEKSA
ncbi:MAG: hypothetical protein EA374_07070 [Acholeplasmatales bacterium]|nr:MAG: hypothetical protein EA374_07070 [Acholeplasmatales bacterium]